MGQITFNDAPVSLYVGGNTGKTVTPYKAGDAVVVAKSKTDSKKPVVILSVTADKKGIVNINKEGKLTAKKAGKVNVTYEFVNEKGIKASYKVAVTVKKASVKFVKKAATIEKGTKQTFKVKLEGYKKNSVTWITAKKNRAEVAENKGKLSVKVKGTTKGADTIYIVVAGKKVAKTKVQVVASK